VLEPGVVGSRVHEVREPQLPDVTEALERRGIEESKREILEFNVPVYRVLDDLLVH
jgi:hypothetical protein